MLHAAVPARSCHRCGAGVAESYEAVPYVGPGSRIVELCHVCARRCDGCTAMTIEVPEPKTLDMLIRCLGREMVGPLPQVMFEQGRLCILPHGRRQVE